MVVVGAVYVGVLLDAAAEQPTASAEALALSAHRSESFACILDEYGVPYAWGVSSGLVRLGSLGSLMGVPRYFGRAVADAYFVPIDDCHAAADEGTLTKAVDCARGTLYFALMRASAAKLAMSLNEVLRVLQAAALGDAATWALARAHAPLHALKFLVLASAPTDRDRTTQAYFFATQLELLHTYFRTQPAAPPQPPSKGDDGPLGGLHRWWRRVRGQKAKETDGSAEAAPSLAHRVVELAAKEKRG